MLICTKMMLFVMTCFAPSPSVIGRAKRPPHWGVQSRFPVICNSYTMGSRGISELIVYRGSYP